MIAHCEIAVFRYRILHMAARLTRSGRVLHLRLDRTWAWAKQLALGFSRLRVAFAEPPHRASTDPAPRCHRREINGRSVDQTCPAVDAKQFLPSMVLGNSVKFFDAARHMLA